MLPCPTPKNRSKGMFELKKYQIKRAFGTYRVGQIVAFSGADAEKYASFIVSREKVAEPVVPETATEEKPKRKYVRKGRK